MNDLPVDLIRLLLVGLVGALSALAVLLRGIPKAGNAHQGASQTQQLLGKLALCGVSTGVPSAADIAALWAAGQGLT